MTVRLPSAAAYSLQVEKTLAETRASAAAHPGSTGDGTAGSFYQRGPSIGGSTMRSRRSSASPIFGSYAIDLAHFLIALYGIDSWGTPPGPTTSSAAVR